MADPNLSWIYLIIFLATPLARIIPRMIAKRRGEVGENPDQRHFEPRYEELVGSQMQEKPKNKPEKPLTNDRKVLRELHQGSNTFEKIQKNTGLDAKTLDSVLGNLESKGLMKVVHKQGMFGPKTELYSTDKGFREYYS